MLESIEKFRIGYYDAGSHFKPKNRCLSQSGELI